MRFGEGQERERERADVFSKRRGTVFCMLP